MPQTPSAKPPKSRPPRAAALKAGADKSVASGPVEVRLTGDLTIQTIAGAHDQLRQALAAGRPVQVDLAADAVVDLTLAQLLESARLTAANVGTTFALSAPASGALLETLNRGGFTGTAEQRAFWLAQSGEA